MRRGQVAPALKFVPAGFHASWLALCAGRYEAPTLHLVTVAHKCLTYFGRRETLFGTLSLQCQPGSENLTGWAGAELITLVVRHGTSFCT